MSENTSTVQPGAPSAGPSRPAAKHAILAPLGHATFRRIWLASLLSNLGLLIMGVGAAWIMTQLTASPGMVALVQTALMLPTALFGVFAGALADMFDRRKVSLVALCLSLAGAGALTALTAMGWLQPWLLLMFCFLIGSGSALLGPSWAASVSEQVPRDALPSAVALNGISYNIARSFGPAIGGVIVAAAGGVAAFATNALLYVPLIAVLFVWRRTIEPSRLPPEGLMRAVVSGIRYVSNSPSIRIVLGRTTLIGFIGGAIMALLPLVARDLLAGGPSTYGVLLGCFGLGAVTGALNIGRLRARFRTEQAVRLCTLAMGLGTAVVASSRIPVLTGVALFGIGAGWTVSLTLCNVAVQLSAPRWVAGRALAAYQASISGGVALGSWVWGLLSDGYGVETALLVAATAMLATPALGRWLKLPTAVGNNDPAVEDLADPDVRLALASRSGPIVVEVEYRVDVAKARVFYAVMQRVQSGRKRNGAYGWSIARDIADPELWIERFHCPTWHDYLRQRNRATQVERDLFEHANEFHIGTEPPRIHRMLERPIGSVRWKDETPDGETYSELPTAP